MQPAQENQSAARAPVFVRVFQRASRLRWPLLALAAAVAALAAAQLARAPFDNDIELMLPAGSAPQRTVRFLRDASFANKVVIHVERTDPGLPDAEFLAALDRLAASLPTSLVSRVVTASLDATMAGDLEAFTRLAPQLLDASDLAELEAELTPTGVAQVVRRRYLQLLRPEGLFVSGTIRTDPLGLYTRVLRKVERQVTGFGFRVHIQGGHFFSEDGRYAMLIAETPVFLTDGTGSRRLVDTLAGCARALPAGLRAEIISGHNHTVSNETIVRRDIGLMALLGTLAFPAVFLFVLRDWRAAFVILVPMVAGTAAIALCSLFLGKLSLFVAGMATAIIGIADDYGIHAYVAARQARDRARALARVARPITVGALTTLSVFVALFLSRIPAYRQFAWVAVLSILLSLAASLFLLPQFITPAAPSPTPTGPAPALRRSRRAHAARLLLFAAALAAGIAFAWRAPFDTSITRLDATTPDILAAEERFQRVWGGGEKNQALCVVTAPDYEQALAAAETVQRRATERLGPDALLGLTSLWPSRATRERNAAAWAQFWNADRTARCRSLLAAAGAEFKFTATAFDPFFEGLGQGPPVGPEPDDNRVFARLKERFVQRQRDGYAVMAFFPDRPETVAALRELCRDVPGAQVVSRQAFSDELAGTVTREVAGIALLAAALIVAVNLLLTRSLAMAATSLLPAALGTAWGFGIVGLLGLSINVTNLVASLVVFGLSVDYGAYFAYMYRDRTAPDETHRAVTLCVTTTVLGAAILLFARHPTLFSIGLTLTAGITAGYIAAVAFTPAVYALLSRDEP